MTKKIHLLIDDIRDLDMDIICRTGPLGFRALAYFQGDIECVYFDHDLGAGSNWDGYETMKRAFQAEIMPDKVQLVTSNPVGRMNMAELLIANNFIPELNGIDFKRE